MNSAVAKTKQTNIYICRLLVSIHMQHDLMHYAKTNDQIIFIWNLIIETQIFSIAIRSDIIEFIHSATTTDPNPNYQNERTKASVWTTK